MVRADSRAWRDERAVRTSEGEVAVRRVAEGSAEVEGFFSACLVVVVVVVVVVVMVGFGLLLTEAGILVFEKAVAAPLERVDICVGLVELAAHCCSPELKSQG